MKRSMLIIAAAILLICLSGCQALEISRGITEAADREVLKANASNIATAFSAYNALNPEDALPDDVTFEKARETLKKEGLWPRDLDDATERKAWELIEIMNGEAKVLED